MVADEPITQPQEQPEDDEQRPKRSMLGLVGVIIVIIVVVLILLMFRGCVASREDGSSTSGKKQIVAVIGLKPDQGLVSAWVEPGSDISAVLSVAGLRDSTVTNMGNGKYVITVPAGTEEAAIRILTKVKGVYDAGRVYGDGK